MADWRCQAQPLAVVQDCKVALASTVSATSGANLPVTPTTQFLICSITKSFTATGVALLHNEGRLDWTKPVRDHIPSFATTTRWRRAGHGARPLVSSVRSAARVECIFRRSLGRRVLDVAALLELSRYPGGLAIQQPRYNVAGLLIERLSEGS
jgi:hypothetical protein